MPEKSSPIGRWKRLLWRILLGAVAMVALIMLVVNPELAALGFLFDPIVLDVAIMLLGTQLLLFNGQIRAFSTVTCSNVVRRLKAVRLRR
jgi:xanthine/uracil permease